MKGKYIMKIYSDNGKEFSSVDECSAYEEKLKFKEAAVKETETRKTEDYRMIEAMISEVSTAIKEYEKNYCENVVTYTVNGDLKVKAIRPVSIPKTNLNWVLEYPFFKI